MKQIYSIFLVSLLPLLLFSCKDTTPPKIFLEGDIAIDHVLGAEFTEPGYSAFDDEDGEITDKVEVEVLNVDDATVHFIKYFSFTTDIVTFF